MAGAIMTNQKTFQSTNDSDSSLCTPIPDIDFGPYTYTTLSVVIFTIIIMMLMYLL